MSRPDEGLIHAWLDGELDADEAARVERLVAEDAEWGAAAAEARGVIAASSRILGALDLVAGDVIPGGGSAAPSSRSDAATRGASASVAPRVVPIARGRRVPTWLRAAAGLVLVAGVAYLGRDGFASRTAGEAGSNAESALGDAPTLTPASAPAPEPISPPLAKQADQASRADQGRAGAPASPPAAAASSAATASAATAATATASAAVPPAAAPREAEARDLARARLSDSLRLSGALSDVVVTGVAAAPETASARGVAGGVAKAVAGGVAVRAAAPAQLRAATAAEDERARSEARRAASGSREAREALEAQKVLPSPNSIAMAAPGRALADASTGAGILEGCWAVRPAPARGALPIDSLQRALRGVPAAGDSLQVALSPNGVVAIVRRDAAGVLGGRLRDASPDRATFRAEPVRCP